MTGTRHNQDRDRVRDASDIVRVVGEHVTLKPRGREYVGLCPFHDDHRPSMYVVPAKGIFHCFVCGAGGDVFDFVQRFHRMDFRDALELLAAKSGIELGSEPPPAAGARSSRSTLARANAGALEFFSCILRHATHGERAREAITRRGIAPEMIERFGIGSSPDRWDGLLLWLRQRAADEAAFLDAGLLKKHPERGSLYDTFRNRLMFPIRDLGGRVVAFGGRRLDDADEPKYVNSPESELFSKSGTLYALHEAASSIQRERTAIVTEGYTDTIACHQAGFTNVVATLGTALTRPHAAMLRRLCDTVVLMFDGDDAGRRAADRAVEIFFGESLDVRIGTLARFTDAKDPDELLKREGGSDVFRRVIEGSVDLLDYRYERLRDEVKGLGPAAFARAVEGEADRLVELGYEKASPALRARVMQRLGSIIGETGNGTEAALAILRTRLGRGVRATEAREEGVRLMNASEHALACVLCDGTLLGMIDREDRVLIAPDRYTSAPMRAIAQAIVDADASGETPDLRPVLDRLGDDESRRLAAGLCARVGTETDHSAERLAEHWRACLRRLAHERETTGTDLTARIAAERERRQRYGGDPRILPRAR